MKKTRQSFFKKLDETIDIRLFHQRIHTTKRMVALCLSLLILPMTLSLFIYSLYSASTMEKEIFRNMEVSVLQCKNNIDYRMEQVEESAMSILTTFYPYLNSSTRDYDEQLEEYNELMRLINEYQGKHMITKLRLFVPSSKRYASQRDTFYSLKELYSSIKNSGGTISQLRGINWIEPKTLTVTFGEKPIQVISCEMAVSSAQSYERVVGVLYLDIDVAKFNSVLSMGFDKDETLFLVNSEGVVLAHPDASLMGTQLLTGSALSALNSASKGGTSVVVNGERVILVSSRLTATNWYLVMTVPHKAVFSQGFFSLDMVRIIIILVIILSFIAALVVTYNIVIESTLIRINSAIELLENGELENLTSDKPPIEIVNRDRHPSSLATLEQNANRMVVTIKALLDLQYQNEIEVRDFQMRALQAQINPHFLYNTLDIIKWMTADGRVKDSIWMVNALSRYFQLSLSNGRDIVRIEEEIELTKTYVGIMIKRFPDTFVFASEIDPDSVNCLIPKLSLQPFVENALLHGILYADKPDRKLSICVVRDDDTISVEISDNGNGIAEDRLRSILDGSIAEKSYGISNVRKRLELFGMHPEDGFEIVSMPGTGTFVTLRFPVRLPEHETEPKK